MKRRTCVRKSRECCRPFGSWNTKGNNWPTIWSVIVFFLKVSVVLESSSISTAGSAPRGTHLMNEMSPACV